MAIGEKPAIYRDQNTITMLINNRFVTVRSSSVNFNLVEQALRDQNYDKARDCMQLATAVPILTEGRVQIMEDRSIYVAGKRAPDGLLTERIFAHMDEKVDFLHLVHFLDKASTIGSENSKMDLYNFVAKCKLPIYPDGDIAAYKVVRFDYMDKYNQTVCYRPGGPRPTLPRERCTESRDQPCGPGLHACSEGYIKEVFQEGDRLLLVKLNPEEVVSVPEDHNFEKIRLCGMDVIAELDTSHRLPNWIIPEPLYQPGATLSDESASDVLEAGAGNLDLHESDPEITDVEPDEDDDEPLEPEMSLITTEETPDPNDPTKTIKRLKTAPARPVKRSTIKKVLRIRALLRQGKSKAMISKLTKVSARQIGRIESGEAWSNIGDDGTVR